MKKLTALMAAIALAALGLLATATAANAYPQSTFSLRVNDTVVHSGQPVVAHALSDTPCAWAARFAGQARAGSGKNFTARFTAPTVTRPKTFALRVSCVTASPSGGGTSVAVRTQTFTRSVDIRVLPAGQAAGQTHAGAALPNTGGPNVGLLGLGGALVVGGGLALTAGLRRRRSAA